MEFNETLRSRRAVREYTAQPIDRAIIERLLDAAVLAPSAENHQPWRFAVLSDRQRIDDYAQRARHFLLTHRDALKLDVTLHALLAQPGFTMFYCAPALILVMSKDQETQSKEDCCLAAQNILLAARDIGLGTCWIGLARPWLNQHEVKAELGIPPEYSIVAPIVIGHPQRWPEPHPRVPIVQWLN